MITVTENSNNVDGEYITVTLTQQLKRYFRVRWNTADPNGTHQICVRRASTQDVTLNTNGSDCFVIELENWTDGASLDIVSKLTTNAASYDLPTCDSNNQTARYTHRHKVNGSTTQITITMDETDINGGLPPCQVI